MEIETTFDEYSLSNICSKNYGNPNQTTTVKITVSDWVV